MKIVHIIFALQTGGSETMLVDIVNEQVLKVDVNLVIINDSYNKELVQQIDNKVKVYFINRKEGSRNPFSVIKLNALLYYLNADIIHCHNHNIIPLFLSIFRRKAVLTLHCMGIPTLYLNKYIKLFAISKAVKSDILERSNIISEVIYNGIHNDIIQVREKQTFVRIFKIVQIGRLDHAIKGQHFVIEAIHTLKTQGLNNIQFDLIGTGNSELFLKELVIKYELEKQINFLGPRNRNYIYSHLKNYDLLIQPSLYEGFGLTVAEAMAAKLPVLVSDINGPMEIIELGKYGFYFQSGNTENLAEQIDYIISNYSGEQLKQKVEAAYIHVRVNFDISTTSQRYISSYLILNKLMSTAYDKISLEESL
jgi:glycosyltransferase involved in cell wall biosynthesis